MSDYLPRVIWEEIFTRLPVKSIIRMRSVCKDFHSLISDPAFFTAHIKKSGNNQKILLRYFNDRERHKKHKYLMLNEEDKKLGKGNSEEIKFPLEVSLNPSYWIVGSVDGLVCFCKDYLAADQLVLWNPSIRKYMHLPVQKENKYDSSYYHVLGFGFDPKTNDYKVVRLTYLRNNDGVPPRVELITLSSQSWTLINNVDDPRRSFVIHEDTWAQTYLNGGVHWIGYEPNGIKLENLIISFHMSDESFGKITLPDVLAAERASRLSLSVLKNMLSVAQSEMTSVQERCFIWLMEEYGQARSWTKRYTIDLGGKISKMIDFRKNGEVIMAEENGQLTIYDTETRRNKGDIKGICGAVDSFLLVHYIDSLVLLDQIGAESFS